MDLLLLNDRIGGPLKHGGVAMPRFVKPCRRNRGVESDGSVVKSDTFLSSMGSRMLADGPAPPVTTKLKTTVTAASGDANTLFVIEAGLPGYGDTNAAKRKVASATAVPLKSARALYNNRLAHESVKCAGRAAVDHIGMGSSVLIDCTPRSARFVKWLFWTMDVVFVRRGCAVHGNEQFGHWAFVTLPAFLSSSGWCSS